MLNRFMSKINFKIYLGLKKFDGYKLNRPIPEQYLN